VNKVEALKILDDLMVEARELPYETLVAKYLKTPDCREVMGPSGARYNVAIDALWDNRSLHHLRVMFSIDDGGWRSFLPLTGDFIMAPDGSFIDEG
jgi:hypothetical protein